MKNAFRGYYRPTENEFADLWQNCIFILDANILLNFYRYSQKTNDKLINVLTSISDRLWIPHQAALEYQQQRLAVIAQQKTAYEKIKSDLEGAGKEIESRLRRFAKHPFVEVDDWIKRIQTLLTDIQNELSKHQKEHPDLSVNDMIRDQLTELLHDKVGLPFAPERLREIHKEGASRFKHEIPPGYKDNGKSDNKKYGDLVLWLQIIDKSRETMKPCIFVTDDGKEDWWLKPQGNTIGPRPELIEEMFSEAKVSFYMYRTDQFLSFAQQHLGINDVEAAVDEVKRVRYLRYEDFLRDFADVIEQCKQHNMIVGNLNRAAKNYREALDGIASEGVPHRTADALNVADESYREAIESIALAEELPGKVVLDRLDEVEALKNVVSDDLWKHLAEALPQEDKSTQPNDESGND